MSIERKESKRREYTAKVILILIFLGVLAVFITYMTVFGPGLEAFQLTWLDLVLLVFATYRMGHLIAYDLVMEPLRQFFTETKPDATGAGDSVEPKGEGFQQTMGQLISCPICSGMWATAGMVYALYLWPNPTRVFLTILAAIGAAEFLNSIGEAFSWTAQHQRVLSGAQIRARRKNIIRIEQPCDDNVPEREEVENQPRRINQLQ